VPRNLDAKKLYFAYLKFKICAGIRYLTGFVGNTIERDKWLNIKIDLWMEGIKELAIVAPIYPQSTYDGMQISLQAEWTFIQRVVQGIGPKFPGIKDAMQMTFLPSLLWDKIADDGPVRRLVCLPVKTAGIALPDPVSDAKTYLCASEVTNSRLIQVMRGAAPNR
jgi:hypothetical protein